MAVVFALRGTSLNAHYSGYGKTPATFTNDGRGAPAVVPGLSFGSSDISMTLASGTARRGLIYPGVSNWTNNDAFAVLIRVMPGYTGAPAQNRGLWQANGGNISVGFGNCALYHTTAETLNLWVSRGSDGLDCFSAATTATWSVVASTYYDVMVSWNGTIASSSIKFSVDGVELETRHPLRARAGSNNKLTPSIMLGGHYGQPGCNASVNEFVVWDTAEAHVYAARTDFISVPAFDGLSNSDPGISNVLNGVTYTINGSSLTGTMAASTGGGSDPTKIARPIA